MWQMDWNCTVCGIMISESLVTTFKLSAIIWGSSSSSQKWHQPKNYENQVRLVHSLGKSLYKKYLRVKKLIFWFQVRYTGSPDSEELSEHFFNMYGASDLMKKLISLIKLPFSDLSSAAYTFLIRMSRNDWSLKKFAAHPGTNFSVATIHGYKVLGGMWSRNCKKTQLIVEKSHKI